MASQTPNKISILITPMLIFQNIIKIMTWSSQQSIYITIFVTAWTSARQKIVPLTWETCKSSRRLDFVSFWTIGHLRLNKIQICQEQFWHEIKWNFETNSVLRNIPTCRRVLLASNQSIKIYTKGFYYHKCICRRIWWAFLFTFYFIHLQILNVYFHKLYWNVV